MQTKELALALRAFAEIADFERSQELHQFATFLERGRSETIVARRKRLSSSKQHPARLRESLSAISEGLRATGAVKLSGVVKDLLTLFKGRPGASVDNFCADISIIKPSHGCGARRFKTANATLADYIGSALAAKVDDVDAFRFLLNELLATAPAQTATWTLVANRLIGNERVYRDRKSAIRAIDAYIEDVTLHRLSASAVRMSSHQQ